MNIKGTDKNMMCRGFQFELGKDYKIDSENLTEQDLCTNRVFHYCKSLDKVHEIYDVRKDNRIFEIEVLGEEVTDGTKYGSNHIKFVREIVGEELDQMKGLINGNTGLWNSGDRNSGDRNSGDRNSGDRNSGDCNSGYRNSGYRNSGDCNSGDRNSGDRNSGYRNSGYRNSGYRNSGDWNSGDRNSGVANSCDFSNGVFCNEQDMDIRIFNKPSGMSLKDWYNSRYWDAMCSEPFILTEWIEYTEKEKKADEDKARIGGYLKEYEYKEAWKNWWKKLSKENKQIIKEIPNFDKAIFEDITGIKVR